MPAKLSREFNPTNAIVNPFSSPFYTPASDIAWDVHKACVNGGTVMCVGSAGAAKSFTTMAQMIKTWTVTYPGAESVVTAMTERVLYRTAFATFKKLINPNLVVGFPRDDFRKLKKAPEVMRLRANGGKITEIHWIPAYTQSVAKGLNLRSALLEEATDIEEEVFDQLITRFREYDPDESLLLLNTNPDAPTHYLHRRLIENPEPYSKVFTFKLTDNPYLSEAQIARYRQLWPPGTIWGDRYIDGLWRFAEGAVWPEFYATNPVQPYPSTEIFMPTYYVGIDPGFSSSCALVLHGVTMSKKIWALDECGGPGLTARQIWLDIKSMLDRNRIRPDDCKFIYDRAEKQFAADLKEAANNSINPIPSHSENKESRIRQAYACVKASRIFYSTNVKTLVSNITGAKWPRVQSTKSKEVKIVGTIHHFDAHLYAVDAIDRDLDIYETLGEPITVYSTKTTTHFDEMKTRMDKWFAKNRGF